VMLFVDVLVNRRMVQPSVTPIKDCVIKANAEKYLREEGGQRRQSLA